MILLALSTGWRSFHSSSPYYNLLNTVLPDGVERVEIRGHHDIDVVRSKYREAKALVCDDYYYPHFADYTGGPKLLIAGDPHAHNEEGRIRNEKLFDWADYVLSFGAFSTKESTPWRYHWFRKQLWDRVVFMPNSVATAPVANVFQHEINAGLAGEAGLPVYPFREMCLRIPGVVRIPYLGKRHEAFQQELARYRVGITCNSFLRYNIAKYVEIPAAGSLLFAVRPPQAELDFLGYRDDDAVLLPADCGIQVATDSLNEVLATWWEHHLEAAKRCHQVVRGRHTAWHRLEYLKSLVSAIGSGGFRPDDALSCFEAAAKKTPPEPGDVLLSR